MHVEFGPFTQSFRWLSAIGCVEVLAVGWAVQEEACDGQVAEARTVCVTLNRLITYL